MDYWKNCVIRTAFEDYGEKLVEQRNERKVLSLRNVIEILRGDNTAAQHRAATEGNVRIVGFLMVSIKYGEHSNTLTAMLLATGGGGELLCI